MKRESTNLDKAEATINQSIIRLYHTDKIWYDNTGPYSLPKCQSCACFSSKQLSICHIRWRDIIIYLCVCIGQYPFHITLGYNISYISLYIGLYSRTGCKDGYKYASAFTSARVLDYMCLYCIHTDDRGNHSCVDAYFHPTSTSAKTSAPYDLIWGA